MKSVSTKGSRAAFNEAYASLNAAQKRAVDTIDGPVMVVAGPGTGKTQIVTLRIANILLQTDTPPDGILALTFTESGAKAMRERLRTYIGVEAYRVPIYTFHGFAQLLINSYPDSFARIIGGRPVSDLEAIEIIETILQSSDIKILRPIGNPHYYVSHILRCLGQLKQEYITPDKLAEIIDRQEAELLDVEKIHTKGAHKGKIRGEYTKLEKNIQKNHELLYVYRQYESSLTEKNRYDFNDMIVQAVAALENDESMLRDIQEQYLYLLADEHQDVNGSQNKILTLLSSFHDQPNIFAVGDEKQAIYRFQGASLENFLSFTTQFTHVEVISLTENYRSGQNILDAAHSLVAVEDGKLKELRIPLEAKAITDSRVTYQTFSHQAVEDSWLVDAVVKEIAAGTPASEIAVIVRTNREVEVFSALLRKSNIAVTASADGDVLRHPITQAIQALVNAVQIGATNESLFAVMHGTYWGIAVNDLVKILGDQRYDKSLWTLLSDEEYIASKNFENPAALLRVANVISLARQQEVHQAPHRVIEFLLQESGFLDHVIQHDPIEGARVVRRVYDEIEEMVLRDGVGSLQEVSQVFATRLSYGLPMNAPYITTCSESVQVMTAHKSKGLEFETVFIPHAVDSAWSGAGKKQYFLIPLATSTQSDDLDTNDPIEDERRLLYVAMTRAKQKLHISSSETNADGKELITARLLEEIDETTIERISTKASEEDFVPIRSLQKNISPIKIDASILAHMHQKRGFSATSLNNYLSSPWNYFYRNVLRIPQTQALPMQFGTAVHNTLEYVTKEYKKAKQVPSMSQVQQVLTNELDRLPLSAEDQARLHEKGFEALAAYVPHMQQTLLHECKEELKLQVHLATGIPEFPEVLLTGKLDRIDSDENGNAVRVIDYKTGKPKSRNVIEGKTKASDGAYKRQLVFYALLLELHKDDRYRCNEGVLSFVEPNAKGVIVEETFIITDEEIAELKETIILATKEIISGEFLHQSCDEAVCEYCHLVRLL